MLFCRFQNGRSFCINPNDSVYQFFPKAVFLQQIFHGGYGLNTDNGKISAWYDADGIHLNRGESARYARNAQLITWEEAAERVSPSILRARRASIRSPLSLTETKTTFSSIFLFSSPSPVGAAPGPRL